jgi:methionyl-tRNA formyltransferase
LASCPNVGDGEPGTVCATKDSIFVNTSDGAIEIKSLQPAGKKRMDASAFLRGYNPVKFI